MSRPTRTEPSLPEWAALGLLCEAPAHGWAVAQELSPSGSIGASTRARGRSPTGRSRSCARRVSPRCGGQRRARPGPARTTLGPTRRGRAAFARWRGSAVAHVRDLRSELMLKLLFHDRAGLDPEPLLERAGDARSPAIERALDDQLASSAGFERTLALWRLSVVPRRALLRRRAARQPHDRAGRLQADRVRRVAAREIDGMPLQAIADDKGASTIEVLEEHRRLPRRSRRIQPRLGARAPARDASAGTPTVQAFLDEVRARHLRDALAAPAEPDRPLARAHRLGRAVGGRRRRPRPARTARPCST